MNKVPVTFLSLKKKIFFIGISFILVAFGQPAWSSLLGILASFFGYALFWRATLSFSSKKHRFLLASAWFSSVQLFQLSWFLSHPYAYIYGVWLFFSLALGAQFGLVTLLIPSNKEISLKRIFLVASCWTLMEWSRLFFLSGYVLNPVGLSLASNHYFLQSASLVGVYGLSFAVIVLNLFWLKTWMAGFAIRPLALFLSTVSILFLYGFWHDSYHKTPMKESQKFSAILAQTAFPVEATLNFTNRNELFEFVLGEWKQMLKIVAKHKGKEVQLIAFPEMAVPFGVYTFVYNYDEVRKIFIEFFGTEIMDKLPGKTYPVAYQFSENGESEWRVNNAYWAQGLANIFNASVVMGLEDVEEVGGKRQYYSSAVHFVPHLEGDLGNQVYERYSKRVLVPMGEYIPFSFCRDLAAKYGVFGSFTCGSEAAVWKQEQGCFGLSICYEEMFGNLMRENRQKGANFLLNITNDGWFPNSKLGRQHLEHARLRSVENGMALVRACNTGITCAIDPLGRDIAVLGENDHSREHLSDSLYVSFSLYNYQTLYTRFGDGLILGFSVFCLLFWGFSRKRS